MPLPIDETLTILTQIGQALHHAHQQTIVHCDLKPDNVLFNAHNEAMLADFGIAAILATMGTKQIGRGGTPAYMAPEQFEGLVSMKSDQYALGCIAYELVTGLQPFTVLTPSIQAMWYQHAHVTPTPPTSLNPQLPVHVERAIMKAIAKERINRHTDIETFISALHKSSQQWLQVGNTHHELKRYEETMGIYVQDIHSNSNNSATYNSKDNTPSEIKQYEEALASYEQAIRFNPNDYSAYYYKGNALKDLNRFEEALVAYEQAIRLNHKLTSAHNNKGIALKALNRFKEALAAYEQAIRLNHNEAIAYYMKGIILNVLKRYEEAIRACNQAIRINPNYADAYNYKGKALERLGKSKEAQQAYEKARRLRNGTS